MFWFVCDPSSGSIELYLTEIRSDSLIQSSTALYSLMMDHIRSETRRSDF